MYKKGQIYFIAALIIAGLIISLGVVYNYTKTKKKETSVYDLDKEIDFETSRIIDYGVLNGEDPNIDSLIEHYAKIVPTTRSELLAVLVKSTGTNNPVRHIYFYRPVSSGNTGVNTGGASAEIELLREEEANSLVKTTVSNEGEKIMLEIDRTNQDENSKELPSKFEFSLKEGENFYIILIKEKSGERFIATSEKI